MVNKSSQYILLFFTFFCCLNITHAQTKKASKTQKTLSVGLAGSPPFVFNNEEDGIAVEIWKKIAKKKSWDYKLVPFKNVEDALHSLDKEDLDLVVGPISITSNRLESMKFSQPFYNSSISILSRIEDQSLWQRIKPFFSFKLLIAIMFFLMILAIVGFLLWLAEHKKSPEQFPKKLLPGVGNGMWLAIVTMTTTGYGDRAPVSLLGRIIAGSWMIISIIFATSMIAGIASTLTLASLGTSTISNIEEVSGLKVATISGSPSKDFLKKLRIKTVSTNSLTEAVEKLNNKDVDAVVYDRPQLLFYMKEHNSEDLYISKAEYYKQGYGFAFTKDSQLVFDVNRALLELAEDQEKEKIIHYYIEKDE